MPQQDSALTLFPNTVASFHLSELSQDPALRSGGSVAHMLRCWERDFPDLQLLRTVSLTDAFPHNQQMALSLIP